MNYSVFCITEACRALRDRVQYWLEIGGRAGDYAENLARRSLLLQSLGKIAVSHLQFLEQPHVLDGDHRLVCERLDQSDLTHRKRPHISPANPVDTEGDIVSQQ